MNRLRLVEWQNGRLIKFLNIRGIGALGNQHARRIGVTDARRHSPHEQAVVTGIIVSVTDDDLAIHRDRRSALVEEDDRVPKDPIADTVRQAATIDTNAYGAVNGYIGQIHGGWRRIPRFRQLRRKDIRGSVRRISIVHTADINGHVTEVRSLDNGIENGCHRDGLGCQVRG